MLREPPVSSFACIAGNTAQHRSCTCSPMAECSRGQHSPETLSRQPSSTRARHTAILRFSTSHDHIVQAKDAFDQTVLGLHQLARYNVPVEIRVVLHRLTIPRLAHLRRVYLSEFPIRYSRCTHGPGTNRLHAAQQGTTLDRPVDYQDEPRGSSRSSRSARNERSIYNSQLCLLRPSLWKFARKSISDWKNIYLQECQECNALEQCGGLFQSAEKMHSPQIPRRPAPCRFAPQRDRRRQRLQAPEAWPGVSAALVASAW